MATPSQALRAAAAIASRIYGHAVSRLHRRNLGSDLNNFAGHFMPQGHWLLDTEISNAAFVKVMKI
jgi:hypothetical protein